MGEVAYRYTPVFQYLGLGGLNFQERIYLVPRSTLNVPLTNPSSLPARCAAYDPQSFFRPPCPCPAAPPAADRGGNVLWIMGFMIVPLVFATGFGIDYGRAQQTQTKLNAIADLAALVAVSPNIMGNTDDDAKPPPPPISTARRPRFPMCGGRARHLGRHR
jgi:hypothetical protein